MKFIIFGLLAGLVMLVAGMLVGMALSAVSPALAAEYENPNLFRPWSDPLMSIFYVVPFLSGVIFAWIWTRVKDAIKAKDALHKGLLFGLAYFVIGIPGMVMTYSSFQVSLAMVASWTLSMLVQALCAGIIFSKTLK